LSTKHTLKERKTISRLFQNGTKTIVGPVLLLSLNYKHEAVLFSVSKKNIPKAVDRNKIKRQMRAIFFNNTRLLNNVKTPKAMVFIYLEKSIIEYSKLLSCMTTILKKTK
jgi:ribonuclease P protein component